MIQDTFGKLSLSQPILRVIEERGYNQPTSIQNKSIPYIKQGINVIATSATGSGKTLCYASPIIDNTQQGQGVQALILAPTRSLVEQIEKEFTELSKYKPLTIMATYGGSSYKEDKEQAYMADIIIGTTGRIFDLVEQGAFELGRIKTFVLDEVDEMLHKQYFSEIEFIMTQIPKKSQKLVFSATISKEANHLLKHHLKEAKRVSAELYINPKKLKQEIYIVENNQKLSLLTHILESRPMGLIMVFANRQDTVEWLAKNLQKLTTYEVRQLHGETTPGRRKKVVKEFDEQGFDILVTTDIAARGLDISGVTHIINYTTPKDPNKYIHRIGRTARAGEKGVVLNFLDEKDLSSFIDILKQHQIHPILKDIPDFKEVEPVVELKKKKPRR